MTVQALPHSSSEPNDCVSLGPFFRIQMSRNPVPNPGNPFRAWADQLSQGLPVAGQLHCHKSNQIKRGWWSFPYLTSM